jgi:streptogramin lyase
MTTLYRTTNALGSSKAVQQWDSSRGYGMERATMENVNATASRVSFHNRVTGRIAILGLGLAGLGMAGCGIGTSPGSAAAVTSGTQAVALNKGITGSIHGGQQPITGATIQLYAVGTTGLKSASTPLLTTTVTTSDGSSASNSNANSGNVNNTLAAGNFTITGDYSCPTPTTTQVYLVATGGNSGAGTNTAIAEMAPLGSCANLLANGATTFVQINELTTVAAAYTLAPFMSDYTHVGSASSGYTLLGLNNAVANFNNLVNLSSGTVGGANLPNGATLPTSELDTLANIIAACINSSSQGNASTTCTTLFGATGGSNTISAALAFATNPGSSALTALYSLPNGQAPFAPSLSAAPNDWTLAIKYNGSSTFKTPTGIAIDAAGNAWITSASGYGNGSGEVQELTAAGLLFSNYTNFGLVQPKGIAIDTSGNVWIADAAQNVVVEYSGTTPTTYSAGGLNGPVSIALDSAGNAWIANLTGNSVTELSSTGSALQSGLTGSGSISIPDGIALDSAGNVYVANNGGGNVVKLNHAGAVATGSPLTDVALQGTTSVAIDANADVWATGSTTGTAVAGAVSLFLGVTPASYSPLANGGLSLPVASATSGTTLWVANGQSAGSISEISSSVSTPLSPAGGFYGCLGSGTTCSTSTLSSPGGIAVDPSGDVWVTGSGDNTVSEFFGLATPVQTPIAANVGP